MHDTLTAVAQVVAIAAVLVLAAVCWAWWDTRRPRVTAGVAECARYWREKAEERRRAAWEVSEWRVRTPAEKRRKELAMAVAMRLYIDARDNMDAWKEMEKDL